MAINISQSIQSSDTKKPTSNLLPLSVLTTLFFGWGFITCMNDILIPHLKGIFALSYKEAMLIQFVFFTAYAFLSLPFGAIVKKVGYKNGIISGLLLASIGAYLFIPAAKMEMFGFFLFAFFVLASGITLLQVSANPFVTALGPQETASSRLNLTQGFNSLGTTVAPFIGSILILDAITEQMAPLEKAQAVQKPYIIITLGLVLLALLIKVTPLPNLKNEQQKKDFTSNPKTSAWKYKHLILGAIGIFVYVGAEVSIGSFLVNFLGLENIAGLSENEAGKLISYYWGGAMLGRFIGAVIMRKVKASRLLVTNAVIATLLVLATILSSGRIAMWTILSVGLVNSIMFPTIFSLAIMGLGKNTPQSSGILCMAIMGGAIIPFAQGAIADSPVGLHHSFFLPVLCYLYIVFYGLKGHIIKPE